MPNRLSHPPPPAGLTVLERGWLSSNNVLLHGGEAGDVLVDSGHLCHAGQTVVLVRHALQGRALAGVVNTHLHSDHCGGNTALRRAFGGWNLIPPGLWDAVQAWDEAALSYSVLGQRCERFEATGKLCPGETLAVGKRRWQALAAPGHDPHSLILFDPADGIVLTADALWERGFGVVFPELDGEGAFDDVARVLDLIESLDARLAIPGHGAPFGDLPAALARARQRLDGFRADPNRHTRHAVKALIKFHLLEQQQLPWAELMEWFTSVPLYRAVWQRLGRPDGSLQAYGERVVADMAGAGVLAVREGVVHDH
ncbi:MAG: MBL fold metallo-hydrolase [Burkholderiales bacterium]|nr:MBL fold metallo-hydrolase [Burkholderiales bacterium]MDE2394244.1 MBL fold metallo-hydrolase [Burkholderiales bacterium]MDE2455787.1 MBL fold metallo-hydrolase [Burkholderiales bacterium]